MGNSIKHRKIQFQFQRGQCAAQLKRNEPWKLIYSQDLPAPWRLFLESLSCHSICSSCPKGMLMALQCRFIISVSFPVANESVRLQYVTVTERQFLLSWEWQFSFFLSCTVCHFNHPKSKWSLNCKFNNYISVCCGLTCKWKRGAHLVEKQRRGGEEQQQQQQQMELKVYFSPPKGEWKIIGGVRI